jgi:hypothetical protein
MRRDDLALVEHAIGEACGVVLDRLMQEVKTRTEEVAVVRGVLDEIRRDHTARISGLITERKAIEARCDDLQTKLDAALAELAELKAQPAPRDGRDGADGKDGRDGVDGKEGPAGKDGRDGADGKAADMVPVMAELAERVAEIRAEVQDGIEQTRAEALAYVRSLEPREGPAGQPGRDGEPGKDGRDGADGLLPLVAEWKAETVAYRGHVFTHKGSLWQALEDTGGEPRDDAPHWRCLARRGYSQHWQGEWQKSKTYDLGDAVNKDGCTWAALADGVKSPPGDDPLAWRMIARKGDRGARGKDGEPGPAGNGIESIFSTGDAVVFLMTDGSQHEVRIDGGAA